MSQAKPKYGGFSNFAFLARHAWQCARSIYALYALGAAASIAAPYIALWLRKFAVDCVTAGAPMDRMLPGVCLLAVLWAALVFLSRFCHSYGRLGAFRAEAYFTRLLLNKRMRTDYENLLGEDGQNAHERALHGVQDGSVGVREFLSASFSMLECAGGFCLLGGALAYISPVTALVTVASAVLTYVVTVLSVNRSFRDRDRYAPLDKKLDYVINRENEPDYGKDIRLYGARDWLEGAWRTLHKARNVYHRRDMNRELGAKTAGGVLSLARDGAAYLSLIALVARGSIGAGDFVLCVGAVSMLSDFLNEIVEWFADIRQINMNARDLRTYLDLPERETGTRAADTSAPCQIEMKGVSFRYDADGPWVLDDVSLSVEPGEKLAVVGENGAGKTTLILLLCGLLAPTKGEVLVNGYNLNEYPAEQRLSFFTAVFQDIRFLPVTLMENVSSLPECETDKEKCARCLRMAGLGDAKLDAYLIPAVNEGGLRFSGGEEQKLALARALYKDAPCVLLDEPTAALDPIAEGEMYLRYAELTRGRTSVFISHRLSSTRFCDRVLFLSGGGILEEGTHEALMEKGGAYAETFNIQSQYYKENFSAKEAGA